MTRYRHGARRAWNVSTVNTHAPGMPSPGENRDRWRPPDAHWKPVPQTGPAYVERNVAGLFLLRPRHTDDIIEARSLDALYPG